MHVERNLSLFLDLFLLQVPLAHSLKHSHLNFKFRDFIDWSVSWSYLTQDSVSHNIALLQIFIV